MMTWWVFTDQKAAIAAEQATRASLPLDTLASGQTASAQITNTWDVIVRLTDGTFTFTARPGAALPSGATAVADESALLPVANPLTLGGKSIILNTQPITQAS